MNETDSYLASYIQDITSFIEILRIDEDLDDHDKLSVIGTGLNEMKRKLHSIKTTGEKEGTHNG